jgi:hypothetical protein
VTLFDVVCVTVVILPVTVVPTESVTVSVRVPPFTTVTSVLAVENALLPSTRFVTVRVRPSLETVVDVTLLVEPSGLRSETTIDVEPSAFVVSTSFWVVKPPPSWSRRMVTTVAPELTVVVVVVEFSFRRWTCRRWSVRRPA